MLPLGRVIRHFPAHEFYQNIFYETNLFIYK
jgi:hypothetical protein